MIAWDRSDVESFLDVTAREKTWSCPLGDHQASIFHLPFPEGDIELVVNPKEDYCQVRSASDPHGDELMSAFIHCTEIHVARECEEEGGQCIVLVGKGGHACVSPKKPFYQFFFSMYGDKKDLDTR